MANLRFIGFPYPKCNHPGGDCYWEGGHPNIQYSCPPVESLFCRQGLETSCVASNMSGDEPQFRIGLLTLCCSIYFCTLQVYFLYFFISNVIEHVSLCPWFHEAANCCWDESCQPRIKSIRAEKVLERSRVETDEPTLCPLPLPDGSDVLESSSKLHRFSVSAKVEYYHW